MTRASWSIEELLDEVNEDPLDEEDPPWEVMVVVTAGWTETCVV